MYKCKVIVNIFKAKRKTITEKITIRRIIKNIYIRNLGIEEKKKSEQIRNNFVSGGKKKNKEKMNSKEKKNSKEKNEN